MSEKLGRAVLDLDTEDVKFNRDVDRAQAKTGKLGDEFKRVGKIAVAAFAAMAAGTALLVKRQIDAADQLAKTSRRLGLTTKALSELRFAAELSGVRVATLDMAMQRFARRTAEAAVGTGEAVGALKELGIQLLDGNGRLKSADVLLGEVAGAFRGVRSESDRVRLAMKLFDSEGVALINMLEGGKAGLAAFREEARVLGVTIDTETAQAAERFKDNLTRLNQVQAGLAITIMREVLPSLNTLTDSMVVSAKETGAMKTAAETAATGLRLLLTGGTLLVTIFKTIGDRIGAVGASVVALMQGEFARAWQIQKESVGDFLDTTRSAASTILDIWDTSAAAAAASANKLTEAVKKLPAPEDPKLLEARADALRAQQEAFDDVRDRTLELNKLSDARRAALEKEAQTVRDAIDPWNAYAREVERLRGLLDEGVITQREFGDAVAAEARKVGGAFDDMADKGTQNFDELKNAIEGWGQDLSRELARGEVSLRSFGRLFEELLAMQIQRRIMQPFLSAGTSFLDSLLAPSTPGAFTGNAAPFHSGGIVGLEGGPRRYVHPGYFANAPRLHAGGLAGGEVAAVLRRGEGVFTPEQMRALGGGNLTVNVINETGVPVQGQASAPRIDASGAVVDLVLRRLAVDASAREQLRGQLSKPQN